VTSSFNLEGLRKDYEWLNFACLEGYLASRLAFDSPYSGTDIHFIVLQMDGSVQGNMRWVILNPSGERRGLFRRFGRVELFNLLSPFKQQSDASQMSSGAFDSHNCLDDR
jgi:hypothetical protein